MGEIDLSNCLTPGCSYTWGMASEHGRGGEKTHKNNPFRGIFLLCVPNLLRYFLCVCVKMSMQLFGCHRGTQYRVAFLLVMNFLIQGIYIKALITQLYCVSPSTKKQVASVWGQPLLLRYTCGQTGLVRYVSMRVEAHQFAKVTWADHFVGLSFLLLLQWIFMKSLHMEIVSYTREWSHWQRDVLIKNPGFRQRCLLLCV